MYINVQPIHEVTTTPNVMNYIAEKRYIQSCTYYTHICIIKYIILCCYVSKQMLVLVHI